MTAAMTKSEASIVISDDSGDDEECREIFGGSDKENIPLIVISDDSSDDSSDDEDCREIFGGSDKENVPPVVINNDNNLI